MDKASGLKKGTANFGDVAVRLSQSPLGIIALFLVLIQIFASLVLGFDSNLGAQNRTVLVWFLVLFPVIVLVTFAWLVATRHHVLYPPVPYGQSSFDRKLKQPDRHDTLMRAPGSLRTTAIGNLYWIGHDLMWAADMLLRQGPIEDVVNGLDQAMHHLAQAGLNETPIERDLGAVRSQIRASKELSTSTRDDYANKIGAIIDRTGATLEAAQGDFKAPPHWRRIRAWQDAEKLGIAPGPAPDDRPDIPPRARA